MTTAWDMYLLRWRMVVASSELLASDTLAEWLRRRPAKPMGSPRVGSNPIAVVYSRGLFFL